VKIDQVLMVHRGPGNSISMCPSTGRSRRCTSSIPESSRRAVCGSSGIGGGKGFGENRSASIIIPAGRNPCQFCPGGGPETHQSQDRTSGESRRDAGLGTGAVASALNAAKNKFVGSPVEVQTAGAKSSKIYFRPKAMVSVRRIFLERRCPGGV